MDFIVLIIPAHNQEIADDTANYQTDRNEPQKSTHQQKQDSSNCGANGKHAFFGTLASRSITIPFGIANNGWVKYICYRASHAHNGADNHAK